MTRKLPPLNWLRSFEASARHLNFTHAANELHLTQAAISKQVKNLEYSLGATLFTRLPSGLALTESGAAYLPVVREAIENLAAATDELFGSGAKRGLTIHVSLIFFTTWLAPRLKDFHSQYPDTQIQFTSSIWVNDHELGENVDLEIRYGRSGNWPNLTADRLSWDHLIPVCSPNLLANGPALDRPQNLVDHTLLHVTGYEHGWAYWLKSHGCDDIQMDTGIQFDTSVAAMEVAVNGLGVALGRTCLVAAMIKEGSLVAPLAEKTTTEEAFYLVYPKRPEPNSNVAHFRDWLVTTAAVEKSQDWY